MDNSIKQISKNLFSGKLRIEVFRIARINPSKYINSILAIVSCEMSDSAFKKLLQRPEFELPQIEFDNLELIARVSELKFIENIDKVQSIQDSVKAYISIYNLINDNAYLIRAVQLIKKAKAIFSGQIQEFQHYFFNEIFNQESSFQQLEVLKNSVFLFDDDSKEKLSKEFENQLKDTILKNSFRDAQNYAQALFEIGFFNRSQLHIQLSECFEKEADMLVLEKLPNTFYPTILALYINSLKELKGIGNLERQKKRIEQKIKSEQIFHSEMLKKCGIKLNLDIDIVKDVAALKVQTFSEAFSLIIDLPIIELERMNSITSHREHNSFYKFLDKYVRYTPKGTVSGISNGEKFNAIQSRSRFRELHIQILREIKATMDFDRLITKDLVDALIDKCESEFIPSDRKHLFVEGIYAGFQNDFITAAHILLPQIENSLKHILEICHRNTTRLAEDIQNDNTLGSILDLEKNGKMLDGICDRDLLEEMNSFLIDGNDVNFRNELCHGLMTPILIDYYGIYLWWLVLKLVKQTSNYFNIEK